MKNRSRSVILTAVSLTALLLTSPQASAQRCATCEEEPPACSLGAPCDGP